MRTFFKSNHPDMLPVGSRAVLRSRRYTSCLFSLVSLPVCYVSRSVEKESTILVVSLGCYLPDCTLWQSYFGSLAFTLNVSLYGCLSIWLPNCLSSIGSIFVCGQRCAVTKLS